MQSRRHIVILFYFIFPHVEAKSWERFPLGTASKPCVASGFYFLLPAQRCASFLKGCRARVCTPLLPYLGTYLNYLAYLTKLTYLTYLILYPLRHKRVCSVCGFFPLNLCQVYFTNRPHTSLNSKEILSSIEKRERKKKTTILRVLRTTDDIKSKPRKRRRLHETQPAQVRGCGRELSAGLRTPYREKQIKKQQEGNQSPKETTRPARGRHQLILISTIRSIEQGSKGWGTFAWCYWVSITLSFTPGAQSQSPRP